MYNLSWRIYRYQDEERLDFINESSILNSWFILSRHESLVVGINKDTRGCDYDL